MKLIKYITTSLFLLLLLSGCESYFGDDINVDPDNPTDVTISVILPQTQARFSYTYGGDLTRYVGIYTQHVTGVNRQFEVYNNYGIVGSVCDNMWSNLYVGTINNLRDLQAKASTDGHGHFQGIGLLMESMAIMVATDIWGDIPYSDAFGFDEKGVYSPTFDSQESIYTQIFANITSAKLLLEGDDGGNPPGSSDLMYGGDISKWIKLANVLEARGKLHLAKKTGNYADVLTALNAGGFEGTGDDLTFQFATPADQNAPFYQYIEQRDDCEVGSGYVALLEALGDPRLEIYGAPHDLDLPNPVFTSDQNLGIITFTEQEFMKAEAMLSTDAEGAYASFLSGVTSSLAEAGVSDSLSTVYLASVSVGASALTLEQIVTQKYIALYTNPEVFNDWRRTGYPSLTPNSGSVVPRRLPYPESEVLSNLNTPSASSVTIFDKVWWD